jgi:serine/threonine protein kinase
MVLEYMPGGELFYWLNKEKRFSEPRARLYTAEITLALEALHAANIVYRDLKPENIMLDAEGHIKLTDFGLAKGNITGPGAEGGTKTFCGTPEYLAPEILESTGHGKAVDWWALGTLLYEMVVGLPPFYDKNTQRMYEKILKSPLRFPTPDIVPMSEPLKTLIRGLLERKIASRCGSGPTDAQELKGSKFLSALNFQRVVEKAERPERKPAAMTSALDTPNFDPTFTREKVKDTPEIPVPENLQKIAGFTFLDK